MVLGDELNAPTLASDESDVFAETHGGPSFPALSLGGPVPPTAPIVAGGFDGADLTSEVRVADPLPLVAPIGADANARSAPV